MLNGTLEPMIVDGVTYDKPTVESIKKNIVSMRNDAIKKDDMILALSLSHTIAVLNHYKELLKK